MSMRLHYHPASSCARRVLITARHLGIELELVLVDLAKGEQNTPEFLKLNPNHHVPVLQHDGFVLWESYAIMQYLADLTPGQAVYPTQSRERADVNRWMFWCAQEFMPGAFMLNSEHMVKPMLGMTTDAAAVQRGEALLTASATLLDTHLAQREWVCGNGPTLADIAIAAALEHQEKARYPLQDLRHLHSWFQKLQDHAAFRKPSA